MRRRNRKHDHDQGEPFALPAYALPDIIRQALIGAPSEAHAFALATMVVGALADATNHWTAGPDERPGASETSSLDALWDAPSYGEGETW